jgi:hypothetical protein
MASFSLATREVSTDPPASAPASIDCSCEASGLTWTVVAPGCRAGVSLRVVRGRSSGKLPIVGAFIVGSIFMALKSHLESW